VATSAAVAAALMGAGATTTGKTIGSPLNATPVGGQVPYAITLNVSSIPYWMAPHYLLHFGWCRLVSKRWQGHWAPRRSQRRPAKRPRRQRRPRSEHQLLPATILQLSR
jgi:hypothetical protein